MNCDCGSALPFDHCCGPFLAGETLATTPEALMRSRYTAFVRKNADYLIRTRAAAHQDPRDREDLDRNFAQTRWEGLAILGSGMEGENAGWVEFAAFFTTSDGPGQLHEKSRFLRENGAWVYADGDLLKAVEWGRNQPCHCGSGKKYKKCHGK